MRAVILPRGIAQGGFGVVLFPGLGHSGVSAGRAGARDTLLMLLVAVPALSPLGCTGSDAGTSRGMVPAVGPWPCRGRVPIAPRLGPAPEGAASHGRRGELPASQLRRS